MNILRIENINTGSYTLRCELPGFDAQVATIRVKADQIITQYVNFETRLKSTGTIKILSKPSQAKIALNGDIKGVSDLSIEDVPIGIKRVEVYFDKTKPDQYLSISLELLSAASVTIFADFYKHTVSTDANYSVTFNSTPSGLLFINGEKIGLCPIEKTLESGLHDVEVQLQGYLPHTEQIVVFKNDNVNIALKPVPIYAYLEVAQDSALGPELVFVNGLYVGETPLRSSKVAINISRTKVKIGKNENQLALNENSKYRIVPNSKYVNLTCPDIKSLAAYIDPPSQPAYLLEDTLITKKKITDEEGGEPLYLGGAYVGGVLLCAKLLCYINPPREWNESKQQYQDSKYPSIGQYLISGGLSAGFFYWALFKNEEVAIQNPNNIAQNRLLKAKWENEKTRIDTHNKHLLELENTKIDQKNASRGEWIIEKL